MLFLNSLTKKIAKNRITFSNLVGSILKNPIAGAAMQLVSFQDGKTKAELVNVDGSDFVEDQFDISGNSRDATQTTQTKKPLYINNVINGRPALRYDGANDSLSFDGSFLAGTDYTIFVVDQRGGAGDMYFIGGTASVTNANLHIGYVSDTCVTHRQWNNDYNKCFVVTEPPPPTPRIHAVTQNSINGKKYYLNSPNSIAGKADTSPLVSFAGAVIGARGNGDFYTGDIGEIIIYPRTLSDSERIAVMQYLSQKFAIPLT